MNPVKSFEYYCGIVKELCKLSTETEWVEFKLNRVDHDEIGQNISALSNSAALEGKIKAYLVWGIDDKTHDILGTSFKPREYKIGNEELENWLLRLLTPKIHFYFYTILIDGKSVVILEITRASRHPVQFQGVEYVRVGSYKDRKSVV